MARYSSGKHALAICDRCGFQYKYTEIKEEWTGVRVCPDCFEPKHPQLEPPKIRADAQALRHPRPETQLVRSITVARSTMFDQEPEPVALSFTLGAIEVTKV